MFNYVIKDDVKLYKLVLTIALFKSTIKKASAATSTLIAAD
jgi:hypothetical protein